MHSIVGVVRALAAQGGTGTPKYCYAWIAMNTDVADRLTNRSKVSDDEHFRREVRFARQDLRALGLLATRARAWQLLDSSLVDITLEEARHIARESARRRKNKVKAEETADEDIADAKPPHMPQPTFGPRPWSGEYQVKRSSGPAVTYAFRFENSDLWKIGYTSDVESRLRDINQHIPVELLGLRWLLVHTALWPSAYLAHAMEQWILVKLTTQRTVYERLNCDVEVLSETWREALQEIASLDLADAPKLSDIGKTTAVN
jgi:hypothetical protein